MYEACTVKERLSVKFARLRWSLLQLGHVLWLDKEVPERKAMEICIAINRKGKGDRRQKTSLPVLLWAEAKAVSSKERVPQLRIFEEMARDRAKRRE